MPVGYYVFDIADCSKIDLSDVTSSNSMESQMEITELEEFFEDMWGGDWDHRTADLPAMPCRTQFFLSMSGKYPIRRMDTEMGCLDQRRGKNTCDLCEIGYSESRQKKHRKQEINEG